jgi:hypothetical protein
LYLIAWGRIYSNKGAMTPGITRETPDGISLARIGRVIDTLRHERFRFRPVKRTYIPKKNGKKRPLGLLCHLITLNRMIAVLPRSRAEPAPAGPAHQLPQPC